MLSEHRIAQIVRSVLNEGHYDYNEGEDFRDYEYDYRTAVPRRGMQETAERYGDVDSEEFYEKHPALFSLLNTAYTIKLEYDPNFPEDSVEIIEDDGLEDDIESVYGEDKEAYEEASEWWSGYVKDPWQLSYS